MYSMHFYTRNFDNDENGQKREHSIKEAKYIRKALKQSFGFTLRGPNEHEGNQFNPETGIFEQLDSWLEPELERIRNQCSLMVFSFALHGSLGYMASPSGWHDQTLKLNMVKLIHKHCDPRVPKVIIFQVCRQIPVGNDQSFHERRNQEFKDFIKTQTENMQVLMAANEREKHEPNINGSYICKFLDCLVGEHGAKPRTFSDAHNFAHGVDRLPDEEKDRRTRETKLMNPTCREPLLPPRRAAPAYPQDEDHSDPEDDGYNLLDFADRTVPSSAEQDSEDDFEPDTYNPQSQR